MTLKSFWWRLEVAYSSELEESLLWKLDALDITKIAIQYSPEESSIRSLFIWFPSSDWLKVDRDQFVSYLLSLETTFGANLPTASWEKIKEEDWSITWKKHWQADPVGSKLLVLPAWLDVPEKYSHRLILRLDPGSAFGTGSHPTTRLCLEALEKTPPLGLKVVDLGCGSGILSFAAIGLGAREVLAVDNDPLAVHSTIHNANLNCIGEEQLGVFHGSLEILKAELNNAQADLLLCNILVSVIDLLAPKFQEILKPKGRALLSGVLVEQLPELSARLESLGWQVASSSRKDRWGLLEVFR